MHMRSITLSTISASSPASSYLFRASPRVSPALSPVCLSLSPPLTLCLCHFLLQEEKGISCGLVDLDFLKCSVGFPFMRAQTKVAQEKMELIAQCQKCRRCAEASCWLTFFLHEKKKNSNKNSQWHTGLFLSSIILQWSLTPVSSREKMTHCSS